MKLHQDLETSESQKIKGRTDSWSLKEGQVVVPSDQKLWRSPPFKQSSWEIYQRAAEHSSQIAINFGRRPFEGWQKTSGSDKTELQKSQSQYCQIDGSLRAESVWASRLTPLQKTESLLTRAKRIEKSMIFRTIPGEAAKELHDAQDAIKVCHWSSTIRHRDVSKKT